jgi:aspartate aminotransferase
MINHKMKALGEHRSAIRELFEYGKKRKSEIGEDKVFDFSLGNPDLPSPDCVNDTIVELIKNTEPKALHGYTSAVGDLNTRVCIARDLERRFGFPIDESLIYLTVGAAASLVSAISAVTNVGDEVIVLAPYFPEYKIFIERCGAVVREVSCLPDTLLPDIDAIANAVNEKPAAIIINTPNNPTGVVYSKECIKEIARVLEEKERTIGHAIYLISDEPYRELVYDGVTPPFIPSYYKNTVICYSFSKALSIPGERIGYCLVSPMADCARGVYDAISGSARSFGYVCAPSLMQKIVPNCLKCQLDFTYYNKNRLLLLEKLTEYGFEMAKPEGAFYIFIKSPCKTADEFCERAKAKEILIVPSDSFGYPGYARLAYCVSPEVVKTSLPAFRELAIELGLIK